MLNNPFVLQQAGGLAERLRAGSMDQAVQIDTAWRLVFGRRPAAEDVAGAVEFLAAAGVPADAATAAAGDPLTLWCHALLCSSGFLYVE